MFLLYVSFREKDLMFLCVLYIKIMFHEEVITAH
jgi:hypothetical protein